MKKLHLRDPHKKYNDKKSQLGPQKNKEKKEKKKILRRQIQNINEGRQHYYESLGVAKPVLYKEDTSSTSLLRITAPEQFSLIKNPEANLAFFAQIWDSYERYSIDIDLSKVNEITPECILYLRSILDILRQTKNYAKGVRGNFPKDQRCRDLFCSSGFTEYMLTAKENVQTSQDVLKIISGHDVEPKEIAQIEKFIRSKLNVERNAATKSIQVALMECAGNTFDHAYKEDYSYEKKWWAMAHYQDNKVICSVLDNGIGISKTMKKTLREKSSGIIDNLVSIIGIPLKQIQDCELVLNAFTEPKRSRFKLDYRGKGLPRIYKFANNGSLSNVIVISNRAFIDLTDEESSYDLKGRLRGTLFSFEFAGITKGDMGNANNGR